MNLLTRHTLKLLLALSIAALLVSCETVNYYSQAARGQLAILLGREDILQLLENPELPQNLRAKFIAVLAMREFAEESLHLPVNDNYLTYVNVNREHVVWNVFAAPEFSVNPINWCYPIAGCVSYRGYFSEAAALRYADDLANRNYDVYTGGVDAYSTLGWFDDSLLSTVSDRADYQLAALIFHELAHQVVYVSDDTTFNESFATAVERAGLRRWLMATDHVELLAQAATDQARQEQFVTLVAGFRDRLDALYQEAIDSELKRQRKLQLQDELRADYQMLKQQWNDYSGYDSWFAGSLNNAQVSTVSSYNDLVPYFECMLASADGDLQTFYAEVRRIASLETEARDLLIDPAGCESR